MVNRMIGLPPLSAGMFARAAFPARAIDARLFDISLTPRLAHDRIGVYGMIPPVFRKAVNNCTSCQSPAKGRPH